MWIRTLEDASIAHSIELAGYNDTELSDIDAVMTIEFIKTIYSRQVDR